MVGVGAGVVSGGLGVEFGRAYGVELEVHVRKWHDKSSLRASTVEAREWCSGGSGAQASGLSSCFCGKACRWIRTCATDSSPSGTARSV